MPQITQIKIQDKEKQRCHRFHRLFLLFKTDISKIVRLKNAGVSVKHKNLRVTFGGLSIEKQVIRLCQ